VEATNHRYRLRFALRTSKLFKAYFASKIRKMGKRTSNIYAKRNVKHLRYILTDTDRYKHVIFSL